MLFKKETSQKEKEIENDTFPAFCGRVFSARAIKNKREIANLLAVQNVAIATN